MTTDRELAARDFGFDGVAEGFELVMSDDDRADFRRVTSPDAGLERHGRCMLCGVIVWLGNQSGPNTIRVHPMLPGRCEVCEAFARRFPDVFAWVQRVAFATRAREVVRIEKGAT